MSEDTPHSRVERRDLTEIPPDPDLHDDLEYGLVDLEMIATDTPDGQVLVLPREEDMVHEEMFLVAEADAVADLVDWV